MEKGKSSQELSGVLAALQRFHRRVDWIFAWGREVIETCVSALLSYLLPAGKRGYRK